MAFPLVADVAAYAVSLGIDVGNYDLEGDLQSICAEFERRTGRPGFQDGAVRTLAFDMPDGRDRTLDLWIPDFSEISSVVYSPTAMTLVEGKDYLLWREDPQGQMGPYVRIEFLDYPGSARRCISVTGTRGYGACPPDVSQVIVRRTLAAYLGAPIEGRLGPVRRERLGAQEEEREPSAPVGFLPSAISALDTLCRRYRRLR